MAYTPIATPNLLNDPGVLFWAPLGSTLPTCTVVGSVMTDSWPVAWIPLGMTDAGSTFTPSTTIEAVNAAESFDPIAWRTTGRTATVEFMLKNFTAANLVKAMNGAPTTVTGSTTTTLTQIDPVTLGNEVRCMLGWESTDSTVRIIWFQVINSGDLAMAFVKAPSVANIPWHANLEKPLSTQPFRIFTAGTARA